MIKKLFQKGHKKPKRGKCAKTGQQVAVPDNDFVLADGIVCTNCGSYMVSQYNDGSCICQECGCIF
jgi:hypothetical protein